MKISSQLRFYPSMLLISATSTPPDRHENYLRLWYTITLPSFQLSQQIIWRRMPHHYILASAMEMTVEITLVICIHCNHSQNRLLVTYNWRMQHGCIIWGS